MGCGRALIRRSRDPPKQRQGWVTTLAGHGKHRSRYTRALSSTEQVRWADKIDQLIALSEDEEREAFFARHPEVCCSEVARQLSRRATALAHMDIPAASRAGETLRQLGGLSHEELSEGYSQRTLAAISQLQGVDYNVQLKHLRAAIKHFESASREDEVAITCSNALMALAILGEHDLLKAWEQRARRYFESHSDRLRLGRLELNVGNLAGWQCKWQKAVDAYRKAHRLMLLAGAEQSDELAALANLSFCLLKLGDLSAAASLIEKTLSIGQENGWDLDVATAEAQLARLRYLQGDFRSALDLARTARTRYRRHGSLHSEAQVSVAEADILLAICAPEQSEAVAHRALRDFEQIGVPLEIGNALLRLGHCANCKMRHRLALRLFRRAKKLFKESHSTAKSLLAGYYIAATLNDLGRYSHSRREAERVLRTPESRSGTFLPVQCRLLLGKLALERGDVEDCIDNVDLALRNINYLDSAMMEAEAFLVLGAAREQAGLPEQAYHSYQRSERSLEGARRFLSTGELAISFLGDKLEVYEALFDLARKQGNLKEAIYFAEKAKSRTLSDLMREEVQDGSGGNRHRDLGPSPLNSRLRGYEKRIRELEFSDERDVLGQIARLRELASDLTGAASGDVPRKAERLLGRSSPTDQKRQDNVRECLGSGETLLEYFFSRGTVFAIVVSRENLQIVPVSSVSRAEKVHRLLMATLSRREAESHLDSSTHYLQQLYELLLAPVRPLLEGPNVVVVPHDFLHQLPFHSLLDGSSYLVDQFSFSYAPSAESLRLARLRPPSKNEGIAVFGRSDATAPNIADEVRSLNELLPNCRVFLDGDATLERLQQSCREARWIHVAAHGLFREADPAASSMKLDGFLLSPNRLRNLELQADLVVLSGCSTGRGVIRGADEILGLSRSLLEAGVRSTVVSLWDVDDAVTAALMPAFYRALQQGESYSDALRKAMLDIRQVAPHVSLWAPFALMGAG